MILSHKQRLIVLVIGGCVSLCIISLPIAFLALSEQYPKGAIVSNGYDCAQIGRSISAKGGSVVDIAIATLLCEGVSMPQSMGIGGGFLMTIYKSGKMYSLNSREVAPERASKDMFKGSSDLSSKGGLSVAVPGEIRGYWYAYKKFGGKVKWKDLFQPTINLCRNGIRITPFLAKVIYLKKDLLYQDPNLREMFFDPGTNWTYRVNQTYKNEKLAKTLEIIANEGPDALYNGSLTCDFIKDIKSAGGIITVNDMNNYKPIWQKPIKIDLSFKHKLYTAPLPGSGIILSFIMNLLKADKFLDYKDPDLVLNWQRIIESFKFAYGRRTELGDPGFVNVESLVANLTSAEYALKIRSQILDNQTFQDPTYYGASTVQPNDHGTAHISVLAPNGDAISVTSTVNFYFGSGVVSSSTGILLNDQMDDFSSPNIINGFHVPPSPSNFIVPGKRPLSSMSPSIILDNKGKVVLVVGAAGGTKITSSVALIIMRKLWFGMTLKDALSERRLHHQLFPMAVLLENSFRNETEILFGLKRIGHKLKIYSDDGFSAVTAIYQAKNKIEAESDRRRPGRSVLIY